MPKSLLRKCCKPQLYIVKVPKLAHIGLFNDAYQYIERPLNLRFAGALTDDHILPLRLRKSNT